MPALSPAEELAEESWSEIFDRCVPPRRPGLVVGWMRVAKAIGDDPALQACALAYLSDDLPTVRSTWTIATSRPTCATGS